MIFLAASAVVTPSAAQVVVVSSPANNSKVSSPVHYVASATSPQCSKGIAAMRIYIADHVSAYNVKSDSLDTLLPLSPGAYNTVVQAWDNCGGVGKAAVNITVAATGLQPVRFLYIGDGYNDTVWGYMVNPTTGAPSPTSQRSIKTSPYIMASDKGGYRLYVAGNRLTYAYFVDRRNGYLSPVPGSPFSLPDSLEPWSVAIHPSGKFVFVGGYSDGWIDGILVFKVNGDGSLTLINSNPVPTNGFVDWAVVDRSGKYLYALSSYENLLYAFVIDTVSGALTPVPGSPYSITTGCHTTPSGITEWYGRYLYLSDLGSQVSGYAIEGKAGTLTELSGSPFSDHGACSGNGVPHSLTTEPTNRFLYVLNSSSISIYSINAGNGALTYVKDKALAAGFDSRRLHADPSGEFLYVTTYSPQAYGVVLSGYSINPVSGDLTALPGSPFPIGSDSANDFALTP